MYGFTGTFWGTILCWLVSIVLLVFFFSLLYNLSVIGIHLKKNRLIKKILKKRYEQGEISKKEFTDIKRTILQTHN